MTIRNLIVVGRASARSTHAGWVAGPTEPDFDLLVAAYDSSIIEDYAARIRFARLPHTKSAGRAQIFERERDLLACYDLIALIDDDTEADVVSLNVCFWIGAAQDLSLWQPSLSWRSYVTYAATLHNPAFTLRDLNVVEMISLFFSSAVPADVLPLFSAWLEFGIDLVWCSLVQGDAPRFAIFDAVQITHTRPVGSLKANNGFTDRGYQDDIALALAAFDMPWPSCVSDPATLANETPIAGRALIGVLALALLSSLVNCQKSERRYRLKSIADHVRHKLTRPPVYGPAARARLPFAAGFVREGRLGAACAMGEFA